MPKRIPQPRAALEQRLREQLIFWQRSATLYDAGHVEEARRLAVHLRVLLHDSTTSSALLTQLGLKAKLRFRQSGYPREPRNLASWAGLTVIQNGPRAGFAPLLDEEPLPAVDRSCSASGGLQW